MHRWLSLCAFGLLISSSALAQAEDVLASEASSEQPVPQPDARDSQEIGVVVGMALGGAVSPGGLAVDGRYLYRLSELDWLETAASFSLGSGAAECFHDRASEFVCDHGLLDGFAAEGSIGIRRYFAGQKEFRPFLRGGVGLRLLSFSGDDVLGAAVPFLLGGGVRAEVANRVLVVAEATLRGGPSLLNKSLGLEPYVSLSIGAGVEFTLE